MKRIVLLMLVVVSVSTYAQHLSLNLRLSSDQLNQSTIVAQATAPDGFMMKDGKMMMVNSGKFTPMVRDITLPNGTKVMKTGSYMLKGGAKMMLKEGEELDMEGNMIPMNTMDKKMDEKPMPMPDKDMNMPDTTKMKDNLK
jgi:hypothetical protein